LATFQLGVFINDVVVTEDAACHGFGPGAPL
jgi:hypothetical protein